MDATGVAETGRRVGKLFGDGVGGAADDEANDGVDDGVESCARAACVGAICVSSKRRCRAFIMRGGAMRRAPRAMKMGSGLPWPRGSSLRSHPARTGVIRSSGNSA